MQLQNRTFLVTGASSGIGKAITESFLTEGAKGIGVSRTPGQKSENYFPLALDVTAPNASEQMFTESKKLYDRSPDIVVINAGKGMQASVTSADIEKLTALLDLNVRAAFELSQVAAKQMIETRKQDKNIPLDIIILGSISGKQISPWSAAYGATKAAVGSFAEALRREVCNHMIRVTLLEPAIILSGFQDSAGYSDEWHKTVNEKFGPLLMPEDLARLVTFIVSQPSHVHLSVSTLRPTRQDYP
jgi:NADP-dependent 3-hydroxy acid dehydrogenase YdfG